MDTHFKVRSECAGCHKKRWFIRKRTIMTPIGKTARSHELFCNRCFKTLEENLNKII